MLRKLQDSLKEAPMGSAEQEATKQSLQEENAQRARGLLSLLRAHIDGATYEQ